MKKGKNRLEAFFYLLLRDYISFGQIEKIIFTLEECNAKKYDFDKNMKEYIESLVERIK